MLVKNLLKYLILPGLILCNCYSSEDNQKTENNIQLNDFHNNQMSLLHFDYSDIDLKDYVQDWNNCFYRLDHIDRMPDGLQKCHANVIKKLYGTVNENNIQIIKNIYNEYLKAFSIIDSIISRYSSNKLCEYKEYIAITTCKHLKAKYIPANIFEKINNEIMK